MKKYNHLLSLLLVPAMVLQAGGGSTCTAGGGSAPPTLTLPGSVTGVQKVDITTATLYTFAVNSVSSAGAFSAGKTYGVWCTNPAGLVPGGGTLPGNLPIAPDPNNPTGVATYTPINSYSVSSPSTNDGFPGYTWSLTATTATQTTTSLTLAQEWSAVNWILNHPVGVSGETPTTSDTQAAIWQLLHPEQNQAFVVFAASSPTSVLTGSSWLLYKDALANGLNYFPGTGDVVGVLMIPATPTNSEPYQGFVVPVPITCPATGSATLTKTVNVGSSGANAFQKVTYTYTITNTGSTVLQNLTIVDDNGTPNFTGDDVTISLPSGFTLAAGAKYSVTSTVFLPITLFYQNGNESAFDTLIPQEIPAAAGSTAGPQLLLTYLIDSDVSDNTYGKNASAGWASNGGHTFADLEASYSQFSFYPANNGNTPTSVLTVGYIGKGGSLQSGYEDQGVLSTQVGAGTAKYAAYPLGNVDSTLSDDLNNYPPFNLSWLTDSPVAGSPNWQTTSGYQVTVNEGIFGVSGVGSVKVTQNHLNTTKEAFSGKCGYGKAVTYTPSVYGNVVNSTAYLCANVCGCTTIVHAKACLSVKLCGSTLPGCNNASAHKCQNPVHCGCTCSQCQAGNHGNCTNTTGWGWFSSPAKCTAPVCSCPCYQCQHGNHGSCTQVGCTDPTCHANNCGHNTVKCVIASKPTTLCW